MRRMLTVAPAALLLVAAVRSRPFRWLRPRRRLRV